jgi:hypothetical protein
VVLVAQRANDLGGERLVQHLDDGVPVSLIPLGNGALFDVLPRTPAQFLDIGQERTLVLVGSRSHLTMMLRGRGKAR